MHISSHICSFEWPFVLSPYSSKVVTGLFVAVLETLLLKEEKKAREIYYSEVFYFCKPRRAVGYLPALFIDRFMIHQFNSAAADPMQLG